MLPRGPALAAAAAAAAMAALLLVLRRRRRNPHTDQLRIQLLRASTCEIDGLEQFALLLDEESLLVYLPSIGLPDDSLAELEAALAACEARSTTPPDDYCTASGGGRRQFFAEDQANRPLGWLGPRRWQRASWRLDSDEVRPVLAVRDAVESTVAALDASLAPVEGRPARPRLLEQYNTA